MKDTPSSPTHAVVEFYDAVSQFYDDMTGVQSRGPGAASAVQSILETHGVRTALDAGCGTGALTILLASRGVEVTAVDLSPQMIEALKRKTAALGAMVHAAAMDLQNLTGIGPGKFDAIFCLGNTLPHLAGPEAQAAAAGELFRVLRPGGILVLQVLNLDPALAKGVLPHFTNQTATHVFDRRYIRTPTGYQIRIDEQEAASGEHRSFSLDIHPIESDALVRLLSKAGFGTVDLFGDLARSEWRRDESKDIVVFATKP